MKKLMNSVYMVVLLSAAVVIQVNGAVSVRSSAKNVQAQMEAAERAKRAAIEAENKKLEQLQKEQDKIAQQLADNKISQEAADKKMDMVDEKIEAAEQNLSMLGRMRAKVSSMVSGAYGYVTAPFRGYSEDQIAEANDVMANAPGAIEMLQNNIAQLTADHKEEMKTLKGSTEKRKAVNAYKTDLAELKQQKSELESDLKNARIITGARYSNVKRAAIAGAGALAAGVAAGEVGRKYGYETPYYESARGAVMAAPGQVAAKYRNWKNPQPEAGTNWTALGAAGALGGAGAYGAYKMARAGRLGTTGTVLSIAAPEVLSRGQARAQALRESATQGYNRWRSRNAVQPSTSTALVPVE
jgi:hypothetical protein